MISTPDNYLILIVDDEPDMHALTRLSLRNLKYRERGIELAFASSGQEALEFMHQHPETAVILLDVVMETSSAGLDACRIIRQELGNEFVRILLRTGQPGAAPEKKVIEEYDIDGYLAKAELTTNRLFTAVRTALKAYHELIELQKHRETLAFLHESVTALAEVYGLEESLQRILETAVMISPSELAVLNLEIFQPSGESLRYVFFTGTDPHAEATEAAAAELVQRITDQPELLSQAEAGVFEGGLLIPLVLHQDLGYGWLYVQDAAADPLAGYTLPMLATHAANALYASLIRDLLFSQPDRKEKAADQTLTTPA
jgi:CheY-like chemotaxis protein